MNVEDLLSKPELGVARQIRPAQIRMGALVETSLREEKIAVIEAGTGTGKSIGYCVPAILYGKRTIISTAKKALQQQISEKDLPFLLSKIGKTVTTSSLKGKGNYVCHLRTEEFMMGDERYKASNQDMEDFQNWYRADNFDLDTVGKSLPFAPQIRVQECLARQCLHASRCKYRDLRTAARSAQITVVNHALLAQDLALGGNKVLGHYDALIIDEAHAAPAAFRDAFTVNINTRQISTLRRLAQGEIRIPDSMERAIAQFLSRLPHQGRIHPSNDLGKASIAIHDDLTEIKLQLQQRGVWSEAGESSEDAVDVLGADEARMVAKLKGLTTSVQRMMKACQVTLDKVVPDPEKNSVDYVLYVSSQGHGNDAYKEYTATPIEIGPLIAPVLKRIKTVVFTSATISAGGDFDYFTRSLGLTKDDVPIQEILPPVFDYKASSCLYIDGTAPLYSRDTKADFHTHTGNTIHQLCTASEGGAFVLCASYEDMNAYFDILLSHDNKNYVIRPQSGSVDPLVAWFKETPNAVVLGAKSLWEGVDVPGLALRLVIIPRLPFSNPEDAVFSARKEAYVRARVKAGTEQRKAELDAWNRYDLKESILHIKQGGGRLIRTNSDKGVVAILDSRVIKKSYGPIIRSSLPHPWTTDLVATKKLCGHFAGMAKKSLVYTHE